MGNAFSMFIWAAPLTLFNICRSRRPCHGTDDDKNAHMQYPAFQNLYAPPKPPTASKKKTHKQKRRPLKSYMRYTQNGRTAYYPVDPFFKGLNAAAMKRPVPKLNLEQVFEESKFLLKGKRPHCTKPTEYKEEPVEQYMSEDDEEFFDAQCYVENKTIQQKSYNKIKLRNCKAEVKQHGLTWTNQA